MVVKRRTSEKTPERFPGKPRKTQQKEEEGIANRGASYHQIPTSLSELIFIYRLWAIPTLSYLFKLQEPTRFLYYCIVGLGIRALVCVISFRVPP